jgi:integrase
LRALPKIESPRRRRIALYCFISIKKFYEQSIPRYFCPEFSHIQFVTSMFAELVEETKRDEVHCVRESSLKTYRSYLKMYEAILSRIPGAPEPYPVTDETMRAVIKLGKDGSQSLLGPQKKLSLNTIRLLVAAFAHHFRGTDLPDLTKTRPFHNFVQALRLKYRNDTVNSAAPITPAILTDCAEYCDRLLDLETPPVPTIRLMAMMTLMYYGFLRFSEANALLLSDVHIDDSGSITLVIRASKTDPLAKGTICFIKNSGTSYSPLKYLTALSNIERVPKNHPFGICNRAFNHSLLKLLTDVHNLLQTNWSPDGYSSHSFRRGGATEAARRGIQDNVIQRHGRWKSTVFMVYTALERTEAGEMITGSI